MAEDIIITYETLYDLLRREKNRPELQKMPDNYISDLLNYLKKKKEILQSQEQKKSIFTTIEVQKTRKQVESIQKIIKELYERRETKIIQLAMISSRTNIETEEKSVMLAEEREFYDSLMKKLDYYRENVLYQLSNCNQPKIKINDKPKDLKIDEKPKKSTKSIQILTNIPKFIGTDLESYGPFEQKETIEMSIEIADLLIKQEKAKEI